MIRKKLLLVCLCCLLTGCYANEITPIVGGSYDVVTPRYGGSNQITEDQGTFDEDLVVDESLYTVNPKESLKDVVFLGDSRVGDLVWSSAIESFNAVYTTEDDSSWGKDQVDYVASLGKKTIVVAFGVQDIVETSANKFGKNVKKIVEELQDKIEGAKIFVCPILPISNEEYEEYESYNDKLYDKLQGVEGVRIIEPNVSYQFESDGIRFTKSTYIDLATEISTLIEY